jgi:uncharacterized protein YndB with AHSA1/START domain
MHQTGLNVRVRCVIAAPPDAVFQALTAPEDLARWWGPDGFTIPDVTSDLKPGGAYRIAMQPPGGEAFHLAGEFLEVVPPARLSYTFRWEPPDPDDRENVATLILRELDDGATEVEVEHGAFATEERRALHDEGWTQALGKLKALLESRRPGTASA